MTRQRRQADCPREPIGLSIEEAAAFIGVSAGTFQKAVTQGLMPDPFELFGRKLWHAGEIETALKRLPRRHTPAQDEGASDPWGEFRA